MLQQNGSQAPDCLGTEFTVRVHTVHNKPPQPDWHFRRGLACFLNPLPDLLTVDYTTVSLFVFQPLYGCVAVVLLWGDWDVPRDEGTARSLMAPVLSVCLWVVLCATCIPTPAHSECLNTSGMHIFILSHWVLLAQFFQKSKQKITSINKWLKNTFHDIFSLDKKRL